MVRTIAVASGLFAEDEVGGLSDTLSAYLDGQLEEHRWVVIETAERMVIGAAYYAPEPFSDRVWNLLFIAVLPAHQGNGIGGALIAHVEEALRQRGIDQAKVIIVETSSEGEFALTRQFYAQCGYDEEARIREFYGPGDDKIVFWKLLDQGGATTSLP